MAQYGNGYGNGYGWGVFPRPKGGGRSYGLPVPVSQVPGALRETGPFVPQPSSTGAYFDPNLGHNVTTPPLTDSVLQGRYDTRQRILDELNSFGQSQIADANDRYKAMQSSMQGDIYSRGFGGSPSMLNSANRSSQNARDRELNRINDDLINRRTQADATLSNSLYDYVERQRNRGSQSGGGGGRGGYHPTLPAPQPYQSFAPPATPPMAADGAASLPGQAGPQSAAPSFAQQPLNPNASYDPAKDRRTQMANLFLSQGSGMGQSDNLYAQRMALANMQLSGTGSFDPSQVGSALINKAPALPYAPMQPNFYGRGSGSGENYHAPQARQFRRAPSNWGTRTPAITHPKPLPYAASNLYDYTIV